jgi:hypothetical protein
MGKRIIISETEKKNILSQYKKQLWYESSSSVPYKSEFIENKNPYKDSKYSNIVNSENRVVLNKNGITKNLTNPEVGQLYYVVKMNNLIDKKKELVNNIGKQFDNKTLSIGDSSINPNGNLFKITFMPTTNDNFDVLLSFRLDEITENPNTKPIIISYVISLNYDWQTKKFSFIKGVGQGYTIAQNSDGSKQNSLSRGTLNSKFDDNIVNTFNGSANVLHPYIGSFDEAPDEYFEIRKVTDVTKSDF